MREIGVLKGEERTGKGGYHWVYYPAMDEAGFKRFITEQILSSLMKSFPNETKEALKNINP
jgi:hypothetical protein